MKRYHDEQHIIERNHRERLRFTSKFGKDQSGKWQTQRGRYRKRDAYDCGHSRCMVCHGHKWNGHEETRQESESRQSMREQVNDR